MNTIILKALLASKLSGFDLKMTLRLWSKALEIPTHFPASLKASAKMDQEMVLDLCLLSGLTGEEAHQLVEDGAIGPAMILHSDELYRLASNKFQLSDNLKAILRCPVKSYISLCSIEVAMENPPKDKGDEWEANMLRAKQVILDMWECVQVPQREFWSQEALEKLAGVVGGNDVE